MSTPIYPAVNNQQAVELNILNSNVFHNIVNGDIDTEVDTYEGNGKVPSVLKALHDMAVYKTPMEWEAGVVQTDMLQPRVYSNLIFVPIKSPVTMGTLPDENSWKLYMTDVSSVLNEVGYVFDRYTITSTQTTSFTTSFKMEDFTWNGIKKPSIHVYVDGVLTDITDINYVDATHFTLVTPPVVGAVVEVFGVKTSSADLLLALKEEARSYAVDAQNSKDAAGISASNAATSASLAQGYKTSAETASSTAAAKADIATTKATEAAASASGASSSAATATTKASEATTASGDAVAARNAAQTAAINAQNSATAAQASATAANDIVASVTDGYALAITKGGTGATTPAAALAALGGVSPTGTVANATNAVDSSKWQGATRYVSSAGPSGGVDGDIWIQYL